MSQADPTGFAKFVPGFEFLQSLAKGGNASLASWVAPTMDPQALDKRIEELKAVQFWLDQNAAALKATVQALEVQKMTLATLQRMNTSGVDVWPFAAQAPGSPATKTEAPAGKAPASAAPARKPRGKTQAPQAQPGDAGKPGPAGAAMPDPMQFWGALTRQFQQIAADAMKDVAQRSAVAPVAAAGKKTPARASKKTPRRAG